MITILDQYELYENEISIPELRDLQIKIEKRLRFLRSNNTKTEM